jgi:hypothetical protein
MREAYAFRWRLKEYVLQDEKVSDHEPWRTFASWWTLLMISQITI